MVVAVQTFLAGPSGMGGDYIAASGSGAGVAYAIGLMFLYQGIALGRVAVVVPVCGVVGILVPLLGDLFLDRPISATQFLGIAVCAFAIVLLSRTTDAPSFGHSRHFSFRTGFISGMGYGTADLILGILAPEDSAASFMVARSVAALIAISMIFLSILRAGAMGAGSGGQSNVAGGLAWVQRPHLASMAPFIALGMIAGCLDTVGHMSYVHVATQGGSMAVAAALVALFPAVVVALAVVFLRERIFPGQYMGLAASLLGILTLSF
jgi:drug/metabolite transporter (DMT)-like permease